jgi:hypothetical protein
MSYFEIKRGTPGGSALMLSDYCKVNGYIQNNSPKVFRAEHPIDLEGLAVRHSSLLADCVGVLLAPTSAQEDAVGRRGPFQRAKQKAIIPILGLK